jgi:hypothetical protein
MQANTTFIVNDNKNSNNSRVSPRRESLKSASAMRGELKIMHALKKPN